MKKILYKNTKYSGMIFFSLLGVLAMLVSVYVYFVNQTVWNVASRQTLENKLADLHSDIGKLESEYMSKKQAVNIADARKMGFKELTAQNTSFVNRTTLGRADSSLVASRVE